MAQTSAVATPAKRSTRGTRRPPKLEVWPGQPFPLGATYAIFNAHSEPVDFTLPAEDWGRRWVTVLDTREPRQPAHNGRGDPLAAGQTINVDAWSVVLLKRTD